MSSHGRGFSFSDFTRLRKFSVGTSHGHVVPTVGKVFLFSVVLNCLFILAYRIAVVVQLASGAQTFGDANYTTDHIWFFCLTLETAAFMLYFAMDSVYTENRYELAAFLTLTVVLGVRSVLEFVSQDPEAGDLCSKDSTGLGVFCVASTVMQCVFTLFYLLIAPIVYRSYGWRFYKVVGSDAKLSSMWKHYQQFLSLKFLDLSFSLLVMTTGVIYLAFTVYGSIISALYVFIELFWMRLGTLSYEKENDTAMKVWVGLSTLSPLYILFFGLVSSLHGGAADSAAAAATNGTIGGNVTTSEYATAMQNPIIVGKMITLASLAVLNRIATVVWGWTGWQMFGHGMLERVFPRMLKGAGRTLATQRSNNGARMVIEESTSATGSNATNHARGISVFNDQGANNVTNKLGSVVV